MSIYFDGAAQSLTSGDLSGVTMGDFTTSNNFYIGAINIYQSNPKIFSVKIIGNEGAKCPAVSITDSNSIFANVLISNNNASIYGAKSRIWMPKSQNCMANLGLGYTQILDSGALILDTGVRILDLGIQILDVGTQRFDLPSK